MNIIFSRVICMRILLIYCFLLLLVQQSNGIAVVGNISVQNGLVDGAVVHTIVDGRRLDIHLVDNHGKYKIELAYNHKYELIFAQKGNFSQKIVVETLVPEGVLQSHPQLPPFSLDINLFTEIPGINKSFVENPVRKIYYNPYLNNFASEVYCNDTQIANQIEQAIFHSPIISKETDFLSKLTPIELAEMKREYDKILDRAGKIYDKGPVLAALDGYMASNNIVAKEKYSNVRSNDINDLLGSIIIAAELDKEQSERFDDFVKEANNLLDQKQYTSARISYNRALSINPNDAYVNMQSNIINELLEEQVETEQYENIIAHADNSLNELLFSVAAKDYQVALLIKPYEPYPKRKLEEINSILEKELKDAEKSTSYNQARKEAEAMYDKQFYEKSLASYFNALNFEPGDNLASLKIVQLNDEMTKLADKLMYDKLITSANKLYKKEQYNEAIKEYFAAADIIPDDKYASTQINIINQKLILDEYFAEYISNADIQFAAKQYNESRDNYLLALEINSKDTYSRDRVNEIDVILTAQVVEEKYGSSLAQANEMFNTDDYENAKAKYIEASRIKPKEKYPKEKLKEINNVLTQIAKTNQKYQQAIAKADGLFNQKSYEKAKVAYNEAGSIKPEEAYPAEMYREIDNILADQTNLAIQAEVERLLVAETSAAAEASRLAAIQAEKDKNYSESISKADNLFTEKNYEMSRDEYIDAQSIKPGESYSQQRIAEIDQILEQQIIDKKYLEIIVAADGYIGTEKLLQAKLEYEKALTLKAEDEYSKIQIAKIDGMLEKEQKQILADKQSTEDLHGRSLEMALLNKELEVSGVENDAELKNIYDQFINHADELFNAENYVDSRRWFYKAWGVKPDENHPKQQIDNINQILKSIWTSPIEKEYQMYVDLADSTFRNNQYALARGWYNRALSVKYNELYPKDQLNEIENKIAERMAEQSGQQFEAAVQNASAAFENKNYNVARFWYKKALELRPDDADVKNRLKEINDTVK